MTEEVVIVDDWILEEVDVVEAVDVGLVEGILGRTEKDGVRVSGGG